MSLPTIFRETYAALITDRKRDVTFNILLTFLPTFIIARSIVYFFPGLFANIHGVHIHHLTYGIVLLAVTGYAGLIVHHAGKRRFIAALYGIGLALAFDEFGIWLQLRDDYYIRESYDAMLIIVALLINIVYFADFWQRLLQRLANLVRSH